MTHYLYNAFNLGRNEATSVAELESGVGVEEVEGFIGES